MVVRFTKGPPSGRDTLVCVRADGATARAALPRSGVLPREACHFVVETVLRWPDAFFGAVARGAALPPTGPQTTQARQAEALVQCLSGEQWSGPSAPAAFAEKLAAACRSAGVPPPEITADAVEALRVALREFGAAWRPLPAGATLERTFDP